MSRDVLLYGCSTSMDAASLMSWSQETLGLHEFVPDFHRCQMEHWLWSNRSRMGGRVMDVGVYHPRRWVGAGYFTYGEHTEDIRGDLRAIPLPDAALDVAIVTEVLEHCANPFAAVAELWRVVKPGGLLFVTSPFWWVEHPTDDYEDYWRFTRQGWAKLFEAFKTVTVTACGWTPEGEQLFHLLRRFEAMGYAHETAATTGYLVEIVR